jgi:hypothetical protein
MKKIYTLSIILLASLSFGQTTISLFGANSPTNENFDGMGSTTNFIPGWTAINVVSGTPLTMAVTDGSTTSPGNVYNVGTTGSADRAFGTMANGTTTQVLGAVFTNNTGSTASKIVIQARMEQWRTSDQANETVAFSYSLDATSLNDGGATWIPVTALDLVEKLAPSSPTAVDGNLASNYTALGSSIPLTWIDGKNLWIKWTDIAGNKGLYAIDNFSITINATLGVKQDLIAGLNMYPNPVSNGILYITSNSNDAKSVAVYDVLGKQVLNSKTSNNAVNVSNLTGGVYFVKITEDGKTDTKKLIVQ